jgi:hypothetical protein
MSSSCVVCRSPIPAGATPGQRGCFDCVNRALRMLSDLELWTPTLDATPYARVEFGQPFRPFYGPRVIIDLDVVAATDYRTVPTEDDHVRSIVGSLAGINNAIRLQRGEPERVTHTLTGELAYLRTRMSWCATRDDFASVFADIAELRRQVEVLVRHEPPFPVGRCPRVTAGRRCNNRLEAWADDPAISCTRCGGFWPRARYMELANDAACLLDRKALAVLTGRSPNTIRSHCTPAGYGDGGEALYDPRAATAVLAGVPHRARPTRRPGGR